MKARAGLLCCSSAVNVRVGLSLRQSISAGNFYQESSAERLPSCLPSGCTLVIAIALQPPVPIIDEAYDHLQAADRCNLLCAPVRTITIVGLPSALAYLVMAFVVLVLKRPMQTWLVHNL